MVIVGAEWSGQSIASVLTHHKEINIVGFFDDKHQEKTIAIQNGKGMVDIPILGSSKELYSFIRSRKKCPEVVIAIAHGLRDHLHTQIADCYKKGVEVHQMPDLYSRLTKKIPIKHIDHQWVIPRLKAPVRNLNYITCRTVDYIISGLLLLFVYIPLFPVIALLIKATSKGPVLFKQKREGLNGNRFTLFKFRTMENKARKSGAAWTTKGDKRITFVGQYLRKFRLDELPQLINIFKGEMALIGPRPEAVELVSQFKREIPFYEYRYLVKPGITGWAQVNYSNTCSVEGALEKLQFDLYWIKNCSIWLNFKIILMSFRVVFTGYGSV